MLERQKQVTDAAHAYRASTRAELATAEARMRTARRAAEIRSSDAAVAARRLVRAVDAHEQAKIAASEALSALREAGRRSVPLVPLDARSSACPA